MSEQDFPIEPVLRNALHEAADQVRVEASDLGHGDPAVRDELAPPHRSRARLVAVGACVLALVIGGLGIVVFNGDGDSDVKIHVGSETAPGAQNEVAPGVLLLANADLVVYMSARATDADVAAVRALIANSNDVRQYAFVDRAAAYREFADMYCTNPDLVDSISAKDLPVSFRIVATDPNAAPRIRTTVEGQPGVASIVTGAEAADANSSQTRDPNGGPAATGTTDAPSCHSATVIVPATPMEPVTSTTLPSPTGPPPDDVDAARSAVVAAYTQAYSGTNSVETRRAAMQDSAALKPQLDQARAQNTQIVNTMTITVSDVTFLDPTHASVVYHLTLQGIPNPDTRGIAVLDNGTWKVARETTCDILRLAGVQCPPQ
jgi:hypothetical protein